jgi:hypothetical protein
MVDAVNVADQYTVRHIELLLRVRFEVQGILGSRNVRAICCPVDAAIVHLWATKLRARFQGIRLARSASRIPTLLGP